MELVGNWIKRFFVAGHVPTTSSSATTSSKSTSSTHVTTATSPSLPVSPPPHSNSSNTATVPPCTSQIPAPVLTICHSSQCSYMPETQQAALMQLASTSNPQAHTYQQQPFVPHQQSEIMFNSHQQQHQMAAPTPSQPAAAPQMVFTGYNMVSIPPTANNAPAGYEHRHTVSLTQFIHKEETHVSVKKETTWNGKYQKIGKKGITLTEKWRDLLRKGTHKHGNLFEIFRRS